MTGALVAGGIVKNITPKERVAIIVTAGVLTLAAVGIVAWKWRSITNFLDITDSGKEKKLKRKLDRLKVTALKSNGWNSNYYFEHTEDLTISATEAGNLAKLIYGGIDTFVDEEEEIFSGIRGITTTADLSYVCYHYRNRYNQDLYTQLTNNLNTEEQIELFTLTNKLRTNK